MPMLESIACTTICSFVLTMIFIGGMEIIYKKGKSNNKSENVQDDTNNYCEPYDVKLVGKNTYQTVLKLAGGRDVEIFLKSDKELKKTQIFPLLSKLEIEDNIKGGIYEVNSDTFEIKESKLENKSNIITLEEVRDINNENAISIRDTDIESNKGYSIHIN